MEAERRVVVVVEQRLETSHRRVRDGRRQVLQVVARVHRRKVPALAVKWHQLEVVNVLRDYLASVTVRQDIIVAARPFPRCNTDPAKSAEVSGLVFPCEVW